MSRPGRDLRRWEPDFEGFPVDDDRQNMPDRLNPASLAVADVARLLGVPVEKVEKDWRKGRLRPRISR